MVDEDHVVRRVAATGVCKVLHDYWEQVPSPVSSDILNILVTKLIWDQSSTDVRVAAVQVS